jgi:type IV secretion system protein VirB1
MLVKAYRHGDGQSDQLRCTASVYNTGHPARGIRNGYVERVWSTADQIVPAIRQALPSTPAAPPPPDPCGPPPSWNGYAVAAY